MLGREGPAEPRAAPRSAPGDTAEVGSSRAGGALCVGVARRHEWARGMGPGDARVTRYLESAGAWSRLGCLFSDWFSSGAAESRVGSWSPAMLACPRGSGGAAPPLPACRPRLLRWRLSSSFQSLHCRGLAAENKLPPAPPARPLPPRQWRNCEWRDQPGGGRRRPGACRSGGLRRTWMCGGMASASLSRDSPNHSAAKRLGDMAGFVFALALCGTLLPDDGRLGSGVCDVILQADQ